MILGQGLLGSLEPGGRIERSRTRAAMWGEMVGIAAKGTTAIAVKSRDSEAWHTARC